MLNLGKIEKLIIAVLVAVLILGLVVLAYQKSRPSAVIEIGAFDSDYLRAEGSGENLQKININKADADELVSLRGIGPIMAGRIAEYRSSKGPFVSIEEIQKVRGIGKALFDKIKDRISVE